uniref:Uncharacterized protein n=1 Tax=Heterorhabditis bacteriophora TaxID=37862 RepID=A0A1I7XG38_HETBA
MQQFPLAVLVFCAVAILSVLSFEKKSDMSEFASAINGASRLRYGKRSFDYGSFLPMKSIKDSEDYDEPTYAVYVKRAPLTNKLIQSLNGAERLR